MEPGTDLVSFGHRLAALVPATVGTWAEKCAVCVDVLLFIFPVQYSSSSRQTS